MRPLAGQSKQNQKSAVQPLGRVRVNPANHTPDSITTERQQLVCHACERTRSPFSDATSTNPGSIQRVFVAPIEYGGLCNSVWSFDMVAGPCAVHDPVAKEFGILHLAERAMILGWCSGRISRSTAACHWSSRWSTARVKLNTSRAALSSVSA